MRLRFLLRPAPLLAAGLLSMGTLAPMTGCSHPNNGWDAGDNGNRRWDANEDRAYRRWENQQRMEHVEYAQRRAEEQRAYWAWRRDNQDRRDDRRDDRRNDH